MRHRTELYNNAPSNGNWMECCRCGLGVFPNKGRFMEGGKGMLYCNLCWVAWIESMPQDTDWILDEAGDVEPIVVTETDLKGKLSGIQECAENAVSESPAPPGS